MAYLKPELYVLASAPVAIKNDGDTNPAKDSDTLDAAAPHTSSTAYESDE